MTILDRIIAEKRNEVKARKQAVSESQLRASQFFARDTLPLADFITDPARTGIIAEFKRASPSRGTINAGASVESVTAAYAACGASAISVLTDEKFFGGSARDLEAARANEVPLLRKDFMIDPWQMLEARAMGADAILLIAACLDPATTRSLARAAREFGLSVLLELHDESELGHVCDEVDVVGINNRNLKTFEVDLDRSVALAASLPAGKLKIAESGIRDAETVVDLRKRGFDGFLIGEQFMKAADPAIAFAEFIQQIKIREACA